MGEMVPYTKEAQLRSNVAPPRPETIGVVPFERQWILLARAYPAGFTTEAAITGLRELWKDTLERHPEIDDALFEAGCERLRDTVPGPFLPDPATFLRCVREVQDERAEARRTQESRERLRALTAGPNPALTLPKNLRAHNDALLARGRREGVEEYRRGR